MSVVENEKFEVENDAEKVLERWHAMSLGFSVSGSWSQNCPETKPSTSFGEDVLQPDSRLCSRSHHQVPHCKTFDSDTLGIQRTFRRDR